MLGVFIRVPGACGSAEDRPLSDRYQDPVEDAKRSVPIRDVLSPIRKNYNVNSMPCVMC